MHIESCKKRSCKSKKQCKLGPILLKRHKSSWGKCVFLLDMMRACATWRFMNHEFHEDNCNIEWEKLIISLFSNIWWNLVLGNLSASFSFKVISKSDSKKSFISIHTFKLPLNYNRKISPEWLTFFISFYVKKINSQWSIRKWKDHLKRPLNFREARNGCFRK